MLLDSVIVIDHLNGLPAATRFIAANSRKLVLSHITMAEVLAGLPESKHPPILRLFARFPCLPLTTEIAVRAAILRRSERWKLPDALQAAMVMETGRRLVTRNVKDFPPARHPFVLVPYDPPPAES